MSDIPRRGQPPCRSSPVRKKTLGRKRGGGARKVKPKETLKYVRGQERGKEQAIHMMSSFNELMKKLEGAGTTNIDGQINALAKQLMEQGVANTMMDAKEKARSMIQTARQKTREFSKKKEELSNYNDPRSKTDYYRKQNIEELRKRALSGARPIKVQDEFQTPGYEEKNGSTGLPRAVLGTPAPQPTIHTEARPHQAEENRLKPQPLSTGPKPKEEGPQRPPVVNTPAPAPNPKVPPVEVVDIPEEKSEKKKEEKTEPAEAKKEQGENPEKRPEKSAVDINDIFNFGKR